MAAGVIVAVAVLLLAIGVSCGVVPADDTSCAGRCGPGTDSSKPCQCNSACVTYSDCCHDYQQQCVSTCKDRCGSAVDSGWPCQCNSHCVTYGDCCPDYHQFCVDGRGSGTPRSCDALTDVTEYFWNNDVNRMTSPELQVNWQTRVADGNREDQASNNLFSSVDQSAFNAKPTFVAFVALLNNYNSLIGTTDFLSSAERAEIDRFYALIRATSIFDKLYDFLLCRGNVSSEADFRAKFYNLWFDLYGRSSSASAILDSSGFEHVMVGELRVSGGSPSVTGFHSWIQFYEEERLNRINYYGYVRGVQRMPYLIGANFAWRPLSSSPRSGVVKTMGSFFLGSSPEFDLALYTICAFEFTGATCNVQLGGASVRIQTWEVNHKAGMQISSAYPVI